MDIKVENVVESGLYRWELGRCIGKGTCSQVLEADGTFSGEPYGNRPVRAAVKIFKEGKNYESSGRNEVEILQYLRLQGVTLYEKYVVGLLDHFFYNNQLCLAYERLSCNLYHTLMKSSGQGLPIFVIRKCSQDVLGGLSFLASNLVIHGDLKLTNIMWNADKGFFQLVDFGLSFIQGHQPYQPVQSPGYTAPEVQKWNLLTSQDALQATSSMCSCASDVWSFACVLLHLYTGNLPFVGSESLHQPVCPRCLQNSQCIYTSNIKKNIALPQDQRNITPALHESFMDLVLRMVRCRPEERIKAEDARGHKFLAHDSRPSLADLLLLPTQILQLNNMFDDPAELQDPNEYRDFVCDVEEECAKFGAVEKVVVPSDGNDCRGKVFVKYRDADGCARAEEALAGRTFNNNTVVTSFFPAEDFEAGNFY